MIRPAVGRIHPQRLPRDLQVKQPVLIARGAAIKRPDLVSHVITVGTPLRGVRAHPLILAAARAVGGDCAATCLAWTQAPLPPSVTEAAVYSPTDGIVDPATSIPTGDAEAIAVNSTHTGLIANPQAYAALATLLAAQTRRPNLRLIPGTPTEPRKPHRPAPSLKLIA